MTDPEVDRRTSPPHDRWWDNRRAELALKHWDKNRPGRKRQRTA